MPHKQVMYYEIETTGGRTLLLPGSKVFAHISGKNYFRKGVSDLRAGDKVIFLNEHIERTLAEVEPFLVQSERYRQALEGLFLTNSQQQRVPVFRAELIRSINGTDGGINYQGTDLEARILREGQDFSAQEYKAMTDYLVQRLNAFCTAEGLPTRSDDAVREWLEGQRLVPSDWNLFYALAMVTGNKAFGEIFSPSQQTQPSYRDNFRLYFAVRSGIMSWLAKKRFKSLEDSAETSTPAQLENGGEQTLQQVQSANGRQAGRIDLTLEMRIVMKEFFEEVSQQYSVVRVLTATPKTDSLDDGRDGAKAPSGVEDKKARLHKGIYALPTPPKGAAVSDLYTLSHENEVLLDLMHTLVYEHALRMPGIGVTPAGGGKKYYVTFPNMNDDSNRLDISSFKRAVTLLVCGKTVRVIPVVRAEERLQKRPPIVQFSLFHHANRFYHDMVTGRLDQKLGLPEGTVHRVYEAVTNIQKGMPSVFYEASQLLLERATEWPHLARVVKRDRQLKLTNAEKRLRTRYGFEADTSRTLISNHLGRGLNKWDNSIILQTAELMDKPAELHSLVAKNKGMYLTRQEVESVLSKYGLGVMMQFIHPNNFIFDNLKRQPAPTPHPQPF